MPSDSTKKDVDSALHYYHYVLEAMKYTMAEWIKIADSDGYDELDSVKFKKIFGSIKNLSNGHVHFFVQASANLLA